MKILIIPTWYVTPQRPDSGIFFREQALALQKAGCEVGIVYDDQTFAGFLHKIKTFQFYQKQAYTDTGIPTFRIDGIGLPLRFSMGQKRFLCNIEHLFDDYCDAHGQPDALHAHGYPAAFAGAYLKARRGIPLIYTEHLSTIKNQRYPKSHAALFECALQQSDIVSAVSGALAGWMRKKTNREITVVPNLINTGLFAPAGSKNDTLFRFLFVGDLIAVKAVDLLVRAFADLLKQLPGKILQLDIVGKGPLRGSLELLCKQLKIETHVRFWGLLDHRAVVARMQASQCLVLSSRVETFGVVLAEAMACGIPVISTDCGGPSDLVAPETGLLAPVGDAGVYAQCMKNMIEHYHRYDAFVIRQWAVQRFGHESVCKRWIDLYKQVIQKPAP